MHFKNVFKSSKGAFKKGKNILTLSDITLCLVTLSSEQNGCNRKQTSSQSMVIFPNSFYEKKSIWCHLSIKCLMTLKSLESFQHNKCIFTNSILCSNLSNSDFRNLKSGSFSFLLYISVASVTKVY